MNTATDNPHPPQTKLSSVICKNILSFHRMHAYFQITQPYFPIRNAY